MMEAMLGFIIANPIVILIIICVVVLFYYMETIIRLCRCGLILYALFTVAKIMIEMGVLKI